jgi:hypothetical protein
LKISGKSILMPLHRGAPCAPKVRWALRWLERKRLMAEILRGMQLMHMYLILDAFNPILVTAVLEAKDLALCHVLASLPLRRQIADRLHRASCVTGAAVLFSTTQARIRQLWWLLVLRSQTRRTPHLVHQNALWQTTGVGGQDRTAVLCFLFGHTTGMVPPRTPLARARTCHVAMEHGLKCATTQCC